ncbi:MAG: protease complex subunit PrcB family protein [Eubacterium sp.]|nr:protease complex subunit PrcB family protein [Eubacterium sp.]
MKKYKMLFLILILSGFLGGCSVEKIQREKKRQVEFTVVPEMELTEPVKKILEERKKAPFRVSFSDQQYTYIIIGYGAQKYAGYRIRVKELYESDNAIFIKTEFQGPKGGYEQERETFPYLVVKIEYTDKNVIFSEG